MWLRTVYSITIISLYYVAGGFSVVAQNVEVDSIATKQLNEIVVEASNQNSSANVTSYFPTSRQKNASRTGIDLLNRMAIPQLSFGNGTKIFTVANQPVAIFINGLPTIASDMTNIRTEDVTKVEYYEYPSDVRFQGNAHVINFIVKEYVYGGYIKGTASESFISNDGQINLFGKLQIKKLTIDLGLGSSYSKSSHSYTETIENYHVPNKSGVSEIGRQENISKADYFNKLFWPSLRMVYRTNKVTISNTIGGAFDHTPTKDVAGTVNYTSALIPSADFSRVGSMSERSLSYSGNWNFVLGQHSTLTFTPVYSYSYSMQKNAYAENTTNFADNANDDSHSARARLQYNQGLGSYSNLNIYCQGLLYSSRTQYYGTTNMDDRLLTYRIGPGLGYSYTRSKFYLYTGVGLNYDKSKYGSVVENSTQPWVDGSVQYSFNKKNRASAEFHYMTSVPLASYRSEAIIHVNPLMSYTGNPALRPYKSLDYGLNYTHLPNNKFSLTVYANAWSVWDRYAFVYKPVDGGIIRKVEQPIGNFTSLIAGARGRANLIQNKLIIVGQLAVPYSHNGAPYYWDKVGVNYALQAYYYLGAWNIGAQYFSHWYAPGDAVNGIWTQKRPTYLASIGWGNADWKIQTQLANPFSWNWESYRNTMVSPYYNFTQTTYGTSNHCYLTVNVAYTFGFGKHVKRQDEASRLQGAGSAILK